MSTSDLLKLNSSNNEPCQNTGLFKKITKAPQRKKLDNLPKGSLDITKGLDTIGCSDMPKEEFNSLPSFEEITERLYNRRKEVGISIRDAAKNAGLHKTQIERIERGENKNYEQIRKYELSLF